MLDSIRQIRQSCFKVSFIFSSEFAKRTVSIQKYLLDLILVSGDDQPIVSIVSLGFIKARRAICSDFAVRVSFDLLERQVEQHLYFGISRGHASCSRESLGAGTMVVEDMDLARIHLDRQCGLHFYSSSYYFILLIRRKYLDIDLFKLKLSGFALF